MFTAVILILALLTRRLLFCFSESLPPEITEPKPAQPGTFVMGHKWLPTHLKKFRRLVYTNMFISILMLLLWIYWELSTARVGGVPGKTFDTWHSIAESLKAMLPFRTPQSLTQYYQATGETPVQLTGPPPGQKAPQGQRLSLVAVTGTKTVLVAAYQEHRTEKKEVRVIAVVLRSETVAYRCILRCHDKLHLSFGVSDIHNDHFGFAYGTANIMCPVPPGCETPSHIALGSAAGFSEDTLASNEFLEVKNQKVQSDSFPYNFTVCLSTMFDFTNVLQLVQSLEMLQLLGVNRVVVYKTSSSPDTQRILDYYTYKGLVEVIPWSISRFVNVSRGWLPEHGPGELHYLGQIPALSDCVYRYMYQSRYVALHDMDELILPQSVNSWSELLPLLENKYGADKCYMFENNVFSINVTLRPPTNQILPPQDCCPGWKNEFGVNILAHLYHEPIIPETHYSNFKIIVNPRAVFTPTVHGLLSSQKGCSWVDRNIARMYHTRAPRQTQLTPDQLIYDGRLLSYSARLTPNVNTVFTESFNTQKILCFENCFAP